MNEIKIITTMSDDDRKCLEGISQNLSLLLDYFKRDANLPTPSKVVVPEQLTILDDNAPGGCKSADALVDQHPVENPFPAAPEKPTISKEQVRKLATMLLAKGKKAQVKDIVNVYAASITDLPEESLFDVHEKLLALKEV